ncbi:MAG: SIMPL domain-containing protein [Gammaproteobacteria bacterium]|nr:SIMPL domain-containing protein [Gammaproteobacteria bacterium]
MTLTRSLWLPLLSALVILGAARADESDTALDRVEFQTQAAREVDNDLTRVVLAVEKENADPARLADEINRAMDWALKAARAEAGVRSRSGAYHTFPVYDQQRIVRWRAAQELILESEQNAMLNGLVGRLQERLQVRSMTFGVSEQQRARIEQALTQEALDNFRERAQAIAQRLGASGYDIVRLQLQDDAGMPPMPVQSMARMLKTEDAAVASEAGTSRLSVGVYAVIQLRR